MTIYGINVPYLRGAYGHDLAENPRFATWPCEFSALEAYRPLIEARRIGASAVRMWLCENAEGILVDDRERVVGVSPRLLDSVQIVQEAAHLHGLRVYWNLLDGNAWPREGDPITRSILADEDQAKRFAEHVVTPLVRAMASEVTFGLDVINEPESSTAECIQNGDTTPVPWTSIGASIRLAAEAARAERDALTVTSGTMHAFLPHLWQSGAGLRAVDVHIYHPQGGLPSREDLARYVGDEALLDPALTLIGGELGVPKDPDASDQALVNYLINARALGYDAAFLWQLEGDLIDKSSPTRPLTDAGLLIRHELWAER